MAEQTKHEQETDPKMHLAFSGGGLDRAAHLRGTVDADPVSGGQTILFWRGKILVDRDAQTPLARLSIDHPVLTDATSIFLGLENGGRIFAHDISHWQPAQSNEPDTTVFFDPTEQRHPAFPASQVFVELRSLLTQLSALDAEICATARAMFEWHRSHKFCAKCGQQSQMAQSGWQRNCPSCSAPHFPRTDPVVIMLITHGNDILLGRSPQWPEGMYSCLAGFVEPGETIESAVRREVYEETQIRVGDVRYVTSQPWPFPNSLMFGCHGLAISREISIDPNEIEAAQWLSKSEMMDVFSGHRTDISPARPGSIAHYLIKGWLAGEI